MSPTAVTAVIPCYNQGRYLAECLASLRAQTVSDWHAVVVDDASTDGETPGLCDAAAAPNIEVLHLPHNHGRALARNVGIAQAKTEAILSLDADDALHPEFFAATVPALAAQPTVGIVYTDYQLFDRGRGRWKGRPFDVARLYREQYIRAGSLFRKSAWAATRGYAEPFTIGNEDWDFWLTLVEAGWLGAYVPRPLYRYRVHAASWSGAANMHGGDRAYRSALLLLDHHRAGFERHGAVAAFLAWAHRQEAQRLRRGGDRVTAQALYREVARLQPLDIVAQWRARW